MPHRLTSGRETAKAYSLGLSAPGIRQYNRCALKGHCSFVHRPSLPARLRRAHCSLPTAHCPLLTAYWILLPVVPFQPACGMAPPLAISQHQTSTLRTTFVNTVQFLRKRTVPDFMTSTEHYSQPTAPRSAATVIHPESMTNILSFFLTSRILVLLYLSWRDV